MKENQFQAYMSFAVSAAKQAGKMLINSKTSINIVKESEGRDIKLLADFEAEKKIREILMNSNIPVLGEEQGIDTKDFKNFLWAVDPLDGTANYNRNIPISCVSIALLDNLNPVLGVIYDFNNDELYTGSIYEEAKLNDMPIYVSSLKEKKQCTLMTGLPVNTSYSSKSMKNLIEDFKNWKKVRMIGSAAIASIYVASGKADFYKESRTNMWDVAAGVAICRAAGGSAKITNLLPSFALDIEISNGLL